MTRTTHDHIKSVTSALELLELLSINEGARLSDLVALSGLSLNQTFRLLETFEYLGFVVRDRDKRYRLGAKLYLLGQRAAQPSELVDAASPEMDALSTLSGENILLAVRAGLERMVVAVRPSRFSLRVEWPLGSRLPLHVGGMGLALLAFSESAVIKEVLADADAGVLEKFTPHSLTTRTTLEAELERVRQSGVRVSKDDYAAGEFSVAAPILGADGFARGALTIAGFTARLDDAAQARYRMAVRDAAHRVSQRIS